MQLELILVPFDVDSESTPLAQSVQTLANAGLVDRLAQTHDLIVRQIGTRAYDDKTMTVAGVARATARRVSRAASRGRLPIVLSGGCLTAIGAIHGLNHTHRKVTAVWVDAHGDFNTAESSPTGYWDGMALAAVCGRSLTHIYQMIDFAPLELRDVLHLGVRALDPEEKATFDRFRVSSYPPAALASGFPDEVRARFETDQIYLHIDLDGLDPEDAPAVRLPVEDGLRLDQLVTDLETLPRPKCVTLSGMSFEHASEEQTKQQVAACLRLIEAAARAESNSSAA